MDYEYFSMVGIFHNPYLKKGTLVERGGFGHQEILLEYDAQGLYRH